MTGRRKERILILAAGFGIHNRGIGQYERYLLPRLIPRLSRDGFPIDVILAKDAPPLPEADGVRYIHLPFVRDRTLPRIFSENISSSLFSRKASRFLALESVVPFTPILARRRFVVIHDLHVLRHVADPARYPEDYSWQYKIWASLATRHAVRICHKFIAVSDYTRKDLQQLFGVSPRDTAAIPNGLDHEIFRLDDKADRIRSLRTKYHLPQEFYLFVGPYSRKKNLRLIIDAYEALGPTHPAVLPVVVIGDLRRSALYGETLQRIRDTNLERFFLFLGQVPDEDMPGFYHAARSFLYPSLFEGFGLPVLESMACGTPVIASNRSSIPEVAGDAAFLIDPDRKETLGKALEQVRREAVRQEYIARGLRQAARFTWERTAEGVRNILLEE